MKGKISADLSPDTKEEIDDLPIPNAELIRELLEVYLRKLEDTGKRHEDIISELEESDQ